MHVSSSPSNLRRPRERHAIRTRAVVAVTETVVGIGAVFGGYGLLSDSEGLGAKQQWLDGSPFEDYTVPGVVLLVVIGGGMLAAAVLTTLAAHRTREIAGLMAVLVAGWGVTESVTIGWRGWQQLVLVGTFVLAPAIVLGTYWMQGRRRGW